MNSNEADKQIKDRLHAIFPDPQVARKVIDTVTSDKPEGWGRRSYAPYYKQEYGDQMKKWVDDMISKRDAGTNEPMVFRYALWCNDKTGMSVNSFYLRINQSIRYLTERLDDDQHKYGHWYAMVRIDRKSDPSCLKIVWKDEFLSNSETMSLNPEFVRPPEERQKWERQMDEYLESDRTSPLVIDRLCLSPDEVAKVKLQLAGLKNVMADITGSAIKIIKINI